eukprot:s295_g19.t1
MRAEKQSLITKSHDKDRFKFMHVVTITEDDNLLSPFGRAKWKRCLRSFADCVFFAGPQKVSSSVSELRSAPCLNPETDGRGVIADMATEEGKTLNQGARAVRGPPWSDAVIERWITRVKIPVVIEASLAFVSKRSAADEILHAISLLARVFRASKVHDELDMIADRFVGSAGRIIKPFITDYRNHTDRHKVCELLNSTDCILRSDELRLVPKEQFSAHRQHHSERPVAEDHIDYFGTARNIIRLVAMVIDLLEDVWAIGGYQILLADNGVKAMPRRPEAKPMLKGAGSSSAGQPRPTQPGAPPCLPMGHEEEKSTAKDTETPS